MFGDKIGKIRSTPIPLEILRTVKDSPAPEFLRWITKPWKTWIRSLLPSRILTCTLTVSPAANSGCSPLRAAFSCSTNLIKSRFN